MVGRATPSDSDRDSVAPDIREIHIDAQQVPAALAERLKAIGYADDHFVAAGNGMERPPFHVTWQIEGPRDEVRRRYTEAWKQTIALIDKCPDFVGYVEAEVIPAGFQIALPGTPYRSDLPFPLPRFELEVSPKNKVSDLHIKVPLRKLTDELEEVMADRGVFYVETPSHNRIYTLQFLSHSDGRMAFKAMTAYFREAGAATEITYEVCPAFHRHPGSLTVPASVRSGSLIGQSDPHVVGEP